jgi:hypothetical protein
VPSALIPTANHPLTPSFPTLDGLDTAPSGHQLVTPPLLLSLLATSIYLSIPSIATQALSIILSTVGPTTVIPYLNFALGKPLTTHQLSSESAVGLENLALPIEDDDNDLYSPLKTCKSDDLEDVIDLLSGAALKDGPCHLSVASSDENTSIASIEQDDDMVCHYGAVSNKIGEASACWLARWAVDMLSYEADRPQSVLSKESTDGMGSSHSTDNNSSRPSSFLAPDIAILGRGGLSAKWLAALVASDTLFVKNERHRYDFARRVVEMRRAEGVLPEEEVEWVTMFKTGIYYTNMVSCYFLKLKLGSHIVVLSANGRHHCNIMRYFPCDQRTICSPSYSPSGSLEPVRTPTHNHLFASFSLFAFIIGPLKGKGAECDPEYGRHFTSNFQCRPTRSVESRSTKGLLPGS